MILLHAFIIIFYLALVCYRILYQNDLLALSAFRDKFGDATVMQYFQFNLILESQYVDLLTQKRTHK